MEYVDDCDKGVGAIGAAGRNAPLLISAVLGPGLCVNPSATYKLGLSMSIEVEVEMEGLRVGLIPGRV